MAQVARDVLGVLDQRDQPHLSPATGASLDVRVESPAHQHMPWNMSATMRGGRAAVSFLGGSEWQLGATASGGGGGTTNGLHLACGASTPPWRTV
jgi:hypothetical protein